MEKKLLTTAARAVEVQTSEDSKLGIPADPEVADFMGAFEETAVGLDDLDAPEETAGEGSGENGHA